MRRTGGPRPSHALRQRQLTYQVINLLSASGHEFPLHVGRAFSLSIAVSFHTKFSTTVAWKIYPSPAIVSPEKGNDEPCIDMPIMYVVSWTVFPCRMLTVCFCLLCFLHTLVPLPGLLTSGLTCGLALRD